MSLTNPTTLNSAYQIGRAVSSLSKAIQEDERKAHTVFKTKSELSDGLLAKISSRQFDYYSDEPSVLGGNDKAPTPTELLLGALCACQEIVVKAYAVTLNIPINKIEVEASGELDLRGFLNLHKDIRPGFHTVHFSTTIDTTETDTTKLEKLKILTEEQCPVLDVIQNPVSVKGSIQFQNSTN
jgi:uncharacterized OsmC-like protein